MKDTEQLYRGYRFHPEIFGHAVWLYYRYCLSLQDVEDLLAEHGIVVSYESIRQWCNQFGPEHVSITNVRVGIIQVNQVDRNSGGTMWSRIDFRDG